jgi:molybdopterin biosynthesis enzyme
MMGEPQAGREGVDRLTPLATACDALVKICFPVASLLKPVEEAAGLVSGRCITATHSVPEQRIALRDGYAVEAISTQGASPYTPSLSFSPPPWVASGEVLPAGTDSVLPSHAVQADRLPVEILMQAVPGEGTRAAGEDLDTSSVIVEAGALITPVHAALMLAAGMRQVEVRQPRVQILVRDDLPQDFIGPCLKAMAEKRGALAHVARVSMGNIDAFAQKLQATEADLVFSIGATGLSEGDHAVQALRQAGSVFAHGLAFHPGESTACGALESAGKTVPIILAPGRFEAALATWFALAGPCLASLTGAVPLRSETWPLTRKLTSAPGIADLVLLHRSVTGARIAWEPLATGDIPWHVLVRTEAFHILPPQSEGMAAGELLCAEIL